MTVEAKWVSRVSNKIVTAINNLKMAHQQRWLKKQDKCLSLEGIEDYDILHLCPDLKTDSMCASDIFF